MTDQKKPKRKMTQKQLDVLKKARERRLAKLKADK